ncbi:potassium voltage-gated channel subfamily B member 1-like [Mercenaria mercenaria]|uniref:potassium voltage-gated channel subfamily B member 1-like n=1 Tax=Mercenaria mercenaria TaxID=6596 RepID=UPI00234F90FE|nr:potassium voltage-gated channel subfamily B member 1-like [Mercenaria mercenaria]
MNERIHFDVCGQMYAVSREVIENGPPSRLTRSFWTETLVSNSECIVINRPPESFTAILAFYQTGELHIPMTSCPGAFIRELEYWEISPNVLTECCYNRLKSFLDDQDTLRTFNETLAESASSLPTYQCMSDCRAKVWETIEYTKASLVGKIYFAATFLMVLLSIFVMACSTDPSFHRTMTNCERFQHASSSFCANINIPKESTSASWREKKTNSFLRFEQQDHENRTGVNHHLGFLIRGERAGLNTHDNRTFPNLNEVRDESPEDELPTDKHSVNNTVDTPDMEKGNGTNAKNETLLTQTPTFFHIQEIFEETKHVKVPNYKVKLFVLVIFEGLTTIFFTIDIIVRLFTCPFLRGYFLSVINCADALSLIGAYAYFLLYYMYPHLRYNRWIDKIAYIQMLRALRFFRIVLNVRAGKVLVYAARKNMKDLSIVILFLITGMCTFASCFYIAEDSSTIKSIPDAWYWAVITMTTVGYGDIQPQTMIGRLIACVCAVSGVLLLAMTVPIFANHFLILYQHAESENNVMKFQRRRSGKNENERMKMLSKTAMKSAKR